MTKSKKTAKPTSKLNDAALVLSKKRRPKKADADKQSESINLGSTQHQTDSIDISDMLTKRYGGISVYAAIMLILAIGIVWTAVLTAKTVQQYHQDYMTLQDMKAKHRELKIEHQRLVIEQQTFSATPQIASRAITELGMFSPTTKDKLILQPIASPNSQATTLQLGRAITSTNSSQDSNMAAQDIATASNPASQVSHSHQLAQEDLQLMPVTLPEPALEGNHE